MDQLQRPTGLRHDAGILLRGMAMGAADVVPGVSGGTIALVCGIYHRLVTAISHCDLTLLNLLRQRQWKAAAERIDFRFLLFLVAGIALGIVGFVRLIKFLLEHHSEPTLAVFFGLIASSSLLVARMVRHWTLGAALLSGAGAAFAFWLTGLLPIEAPLTYPYLFLCAMVAICAMILPGISGAFILLILGMYGHVIGVVSDVTRGQITFDNLLFVAVFGSGCVVGLVGFSKILKMLLVRFESGTMALLCGFMVGSLRRVWPFQEDGVNYLPPAERIWLPVLLAVAAAAAVLVFDLVARRIGAAQAKRDAEARLAANRPSSPQEEAHSHAPPRETLSL